MQDLTRLMIAAAAFIAAACSDDSPTNLRRPSNIATAEAPSPLAPKAPTGLIAAAQFMDIYLTWTDNSGDEDGFLVETLQSPSYDWGPPGGYPANTTTAYTRSNSSADQYIQFRVTAYNKYGKSAPSNVATAWVLNPPTNVAVTLFDQHTVDITWVHAGSRHPMPIAIG